MSVILQKNSNPEKNSVFSTAGIEPATIQCVALRLQSYALPTELSREMTLTKVEKQIIHTVEQIFYTSCIAVPEQQQHAHHATYKHQN